MPDTTLDSHAIYAEMLRILEAMRDNKPDNRSEESRRWAVSITEMEKDIAYFRCYVVMEAE